MQAKRTLLLKPEWIIAILVTAAAAVMHFYYWLHVGGLWRDEVNLLSISGSHSMGDMTRDSFPVLMPLAIHAWIAAGLGNSDLNLRLPGLFVGLGILAALWISSWKIRRAPPLLGLVLFGLNSWLIFFGDSLRAYGLGSLAAVALTASAFCFLQKPSNGRAAWLAFFAILSVQVLYHNAVLVAAICFGAWAVCWRRKNGRTAVQTLLAAILAAASLLPYAHGLIASAGNSDVLRSGVKLPRFFASYTDTLGYPLPGYIWVWLSLYVAVIAFAVAGLRQKAQEPAKIENTFSDGDLNLFAAVTLTFATIGFPLFFWRAQLPMQSWYVLPFMATAVVCFDAALPYRGKILGTAFLIFVIGTAIKSTSSTARILTQHFSNVDIYARALTVKEAPNDYIIVEPWFFGITFNHYFKGRTPWDTLPPLADHSTHHFDLVQQQLQNTNAIAPVLRQIAGTLQSGHRVWILADKGWMGVPPAGTHPPASLPPAPLKDTGWSDLPYARVWASQVAFFLSNHSCKFAQLEIPSNERYVTEDMVLFAADGWSTNSAP
jgi:hypothetical protein